MKKAAIISIVGVVGLILFSMFSINMGNEGVAGETQDGCLVGGITVECPNEINQITLKAVPAGADVVLIEDSAASWAKKKATVASLGGGGVFGQNYQTQASLGTSTTTSATFQDKVTLTTAAITGDMFVTWQAVISSDNKEYEVRLYDTTSATVITNEYNKTADSDYFWPTAGHGIVSLTGSAHTLKVQWRDIGGGDTITIEKARITVWRVQ
jgi:hypothetical protein